VLAGLSHVRGKFIAVLSGRFLRHIYEGSAPARRRQEGQPIAANSITQHFKSSWIDDFYTSGAIVFWQMPAISEGFDLPGEHDVAPSLTKWGSGTVDVLISEMQLTITSWDIDPQGQKSKAIETLDNRE